MTDDPGVKNMLTFNLARDTYHQNLWLAAIEELKADGGQGEGCDRPRIVARSKLGTRNFALRLPTRTE